MFRNSYYIAFLFLLGFAFSYNLEAQEAGITNKSETIQLVDGKKYYFHAVLQSQTLFSIARAYGVSQEAIIRENPELESGLRYGQLIRIPAEADKPQIEIKKQEVEYIEHRVRRRETLYGISRQYEVSQELILEHNLDARRGLQPNQVLRIPVIHEQDQKDDNFTFYIVNPGDTPYAISRQFEIPLDTLERYNEGILDGIRVGQRIAIPHYKYLHRVQEETKVLRDSIFEFEGRQEVKTEEFDEEYCVDPKLKDEYNVALMIPLYLDRISEDDIISGRLPLNHPSFEFIQFYEGILLALDSVSKAGANINLHVFDVCQDHSKVIKVINSIDFSKIDLIIGPFFEESIKQIIYYAERYDIAVVSPFHSNTQQLKMSANLIQATPSLKAQLEKLADFLSNNFYDHNIVLVHTDNVQIMPTIEQFKTRMNANINRRQYIIDSINLARIDPFFYSDTYVGERTSQFYLFDDSIIKAHSVQKNDSILATYLNRDNIREFSVARDTIGGLLLELDSMRNNLVIGLVGGEVHVSNLLRQLHVYRDTFDITVAGIPQWRNLQSVDFRYMNSLRVHLFASDYIDYSDLHIQYFIDDFRKNYYSEPGRDAFRGVMTGHYFFNALNLYGKEFYKCIGLINQVNSVKNPFYFSRTMGDDGGWENKKSTILKYQNYRIVDLMKQAKEQESVISGH